VVNVFLRYVAYNVLCVMPSTWGVALTEPLGDWSGTRAREVFTVRLRLSMAAMYAREGYPSGLLGRQLRCHDREPGLRGLTKASQFAVLNSPDGCRCPHHDTRSGRTLERQHHRPRCAMLFTRRSNSAVTTEQRPFSSVGRASPW
jgi:hypothetical protein